MTHPTPPAERGMPEAAFRAPCLICGKIVVVPTSDGSGLCDICGAKRDAWNRRAPQPPAISRRERIATTLLAGSMGSEWTAGACDTALARNALRRADALIAALDGEDEA